jgi:hypothetical protein
MLYKIIILILLLALICYLLNNNNFFKCDNKEDLSLLNTNRNSTRLDNKKSNLKMKNEERELVEKNQDYEELLERNDEDLVYFQNDFINQSKITEDAYDVVNCIDKVDYGDVTTGMDKCEKSCGGVCLELGYTGVATCFPKADKPFDWGTLYKNPEFTYGLTQDGQEPYFKGNFNYQF